MKQYFSIGQMAHLFSINISTLRYYDEIGLLKPAYVDPNSHYRYYATPQFERLNTIKYLRALDIPLEKIAAFFENKDLSLLLHTLHEQQEWIQQQIQQLEQIHRKLQHRAEQLSDALYRPLGKFQIVTFPPREAVFLRKDISWNDDLEYPLRELESQNQLTPALFLGKVGLLLPLSALQKQQFGHFSAIFVLLESDDRYQGHTHTFPGGTYLTLRFSGTHIDATPYYQKMLSFLQQHHWSPNGDAIEITLIDAGLTNDRSQYVTELQLPIWKSIENP